MKFILCLVSKFAIEIKIGTDLEIKPLFPSLTIIDLRLKRKLQRTDVEDDEIRENAFKIWKVVKSLVIMRDLKESTLPRFGDD